MSTTVLVVGADDRLARSLAGALRSRGYRVLPAATAAAARALAGTAARYDAVLLDPALPDGDGLGLCTSLRGDEDAAVIALVAGHSEGDRVRALQAGADDCLPKPFGMAELLARLGAVLRRRRRPGTAAGGLRVDMAAHRAYAGGLPLTLSHKELQLLAILLAEPGVVVSRQRLAGEIWNLPRMGGSRTLDVHVAKLRAKIRPVAAVESVRGVGYRLVVSR